VRDVVPSMATDWEFSRALDHAQALVTSGALVRLAGFADVPTFNE
jgi:hypothetical protein